MNEEYFIRYLLIIWMNYVFLVDMLVFKRVGVWYNSFDFVGKKSCSVERGVCCCCCLFICLLLCVCLLVFFIEWVFSCGDVGLFLMLNCNFEWVYFGLIISCCVFFFYCCLVEFVVIVKEEDEVLWLDWCDVVVVLWCSVDWGRVVILGLCGVGIGVVGCCGLILFVWWWLG